MYAYAFPITIDHFASRQHRTMSGLEFTIFCGKCFALVSCDHGNGSVLSCGDFLCHRCSQQLQSTSICPACGRSGVRAIVLDGPLPDEVKGSIEDPMKTLDSLFQTLGFQVKYYKSTIRKLFSRLKDSESEVVQKTT